MWRRIASQALTGYALSAFVTTDRVMYQTPQLGKLFVGCLREHAYLQGVQKRQPIFVMMRVSHHSMRTQDRQQNVLKPASSLMSSDYLAHLDCGRGISGPRPRPGATFSPVRR